MPEQQQKNPRATPRASYQLCSFYSENVISTNSNSKLSAFDRCSTNFLFDFSYYHRYGENVHCVSFLLRRASPPTHLYYEIYSSLYSKLFFAVVSFDFLAFRDSIFFFFFFVINFIWFDPVSSLIAYRNSLVEIQLYNLHFTLLDLKCDIAFFMQQLAYIFYVKILEKSCIDKICDEKCEKCW